MGEPEDLHPFSSHFRAQLSDVLSRPGIVSHMKQRPDEKLYLETEIDAYSGVEFDKRSTANCPRRPPTPPKPVHRTFTFDKTNPFSDDSKVVNTLSLPKYAEVKKPKNRPKVPPKPQIRSIADTSTLPHAQKQADEQTKISKEDSIRVNSLPNLAPELKEKITVPGNFLTADSRNSSAPGYGQLNRKRQSIESNVSEYHMAHQGADYCDVIPESQTPNGTNTETPPSDGRYENIYEDVHSKELDSEKVHLQLSPATDQGSDSDYTLMCSPVSEIHFSFGRKSLYENCETINSPNPGVFHPNDYENIGSQFPMGDPNIVGVPGQVRGSQILALSKEHVSPTSSFDDQDSSVYSVQSSMASTTASSFQRVQVCFFPPSPPPEFYHEGGAAAERPGSATSGSSTRSRSSRSRIPVPIKPKSKDLTKTQHSTSAPVHDQQLPSTPTPSPAVRSKSGSRNIEKMVTPPPPRSNESVPNGKALTSSAAKGAKWYEKLGCIQTDTIQPSEAYGRPGERKRSKSVTREQQRKSQFFLPVEPNASDPPNVRRT